MESASNATSYAQSFMEVCNRLCLSAREQDYARKFSNDFIKLCRNTDYCQERNRFNFGVDPSFNGQMVTIWVFR